MYRVNFVLLEKSTPPPPPLGPFFGVSYDEGIFLSPCNSSQGDVLKF